MKRLHFAVRMLLNLERMSYAKGYHLSLSVLIFASKAWCEKTEGGKSVQSTRTTWQLQKHTSSSDVRCFKDQQGNWSKNPGQDGGWIKPSTHLCRSPVKAEMCLITATGSPALPCTVEGCMCLCVCVCVNVCALCGTKVCVIWSMLPHQKRRLQGDTIKRF